MSNGYFYCDHFSSPVFIHFAAVSALINYTAAEQSSTGDLLALLAIKSMIKDDPQGVMTSWSHSTTNFCQWQGVTCSPQHQRVTHLNLSSRGLTGMLSPSIGNLSFLRDIRLSKNSFYGEITPEIGRLFRLQILSLYNNSFTGTIPTAIMDCSNLQVVRLGFNNLTGKIPDGIGSLSMLNFFNLHGLILKGGIPLFIANLTLLESLSLADCQLGGSFPDVFHRLTNLRSLALPGNNLTGTIPPSLYNCSSLEQVILYDNQLNGRLPMIFDIPPTLKELRLDSNEFWGKLPSLSNGSSLIILSLSNNYFMGSLHNLVCSNGVSMIGVLDLRYNHLTGDIPECWEKWSSLYFLSFSNNNLSGEFPKTLGSIPSLKILDMHGNKFREKLTNSFWKLPPNLIHLDVSENQFHGTLFGIPETLNEFWGSLHQLLCSNDTKGTTALYLGDNHLSGVIPECWEKWPSLILLDLQNNKFSGEIPRTLGSIPSLQLLNMCGNKITGRLPSSLMNLSHLKILQLGRNNLVDSIPSWIGIKLALLKILNLRYNNFYGSIPHELCYLSHAQILDLAHNKLSGNIPRCFNNFSVLSPNLDVQFSFSFSDGSSTASDSLVMKGQESTYEAFLGLVMLLDLSSNNFSGQIPSELTTLHELKSLNLSRNQLTGRIPDNIGDMKSLESFDLSINKLSGELPKTLSKLNFLSSFNVSNNNLVGRVPTGTQIQSFNESSFLGNKLCGAPLINGCVPIDVHDTIADQKEDDGSHEEDSGLVISIVLGFVIGFWIIVISSWRTSYFHLLNKLIKVYCL